MVSNLPQRIDESLEIDSLGLSIANHVDHEVPLFVTLLGNVASNVLKNFIVKVIWRRDAFLRNGIEHLGNLLYLGNLWVVFVLIQCETVFERDFMDRCIEPKDWKLLVELVFIYYM